MAFKIARGNAPLASLLHEATGGIPIGTSSHIGLQNGQRLAALSALDGYVDFIQHEFTPANDGAYPVDSLTYDGANLAVSHDGHVIGPAATWAKPPYAFQPGFQLIARLQQQWEGMLGVWSAATGPVLPNPILGLTSQGGMQWEINRQLQKIVPAQLLAVTAQSPAQYHYGMLRYAFPDANPMSASAFLLSWEKLPQALELIAQHLPHHFYEWVEQGVRRPLRDVGPIRARYHGGPQVPTERLAKIALQLMQYLSNILSRPGEIPDVFRMTGPILNTTAYVVLPVMVQLARSGGNLVHHISGTSMVTYLLDDEGAAERRAEIEELWDLLAGPLGLPRHVTYVLHPSNHLKHFWQPEWAAPTVNRLLEIYEEWNTFAEQLSHRARAIREEVDREAPEDDVSLRVWSEEQVQGLNPRQLNALKRTQNREAIQQLVAGTRSETDPERTALREQQVKLETESGLLLATPAGQCFLRGFSSSQLDVVLGGWSLHPIALSKEPYELEGIVNWMKKRANWRAK